MFEILAGIVIESSILFARMAPYLLLGIGVAGLLHVLLPVGVVARQLGGAGHGSVFKAAVLGVPLPLCSCSVVPVAASLKKSGASNGSVVSFLITTPTSGVDSILATYSLLGGAFAVVRVFASFVIGLIAGIATSLGSRSSSEVSDSEAPPPRAPSVEPSGNRLSRALVYGADELFGGIARPLLVGTLLGGAVALLLPPDLLEDYIGQGWLSYLVMLAVAVPLYVCASGSIPFAAALLLKGISPGAALIFLIAGPATNAATVTVIYRMVGKRALVIYLGLLVAGSFAAALVTDAFFATYPSLLPTLSAAGHHAGHLSRLEILSGAVLGALTLFHLARQLAARFGLNRKGETAMATTRFKVEDMTCQHCVRTIEGAVGELPGVRSVHADPASKLVSLDLDDDADTEAVTRAITDAGYHPKPVAE
jgi:copper ion binding protein